MHSRRWLFADNLAAKCSKSRQFSGIELRIHPCFCQIWSNRSLWQPRHWESPSREPCSTFFWIYSLPRHMSHHLVKPWQLSEHFISGRIRSTRILYHRGSLKGYSRGNERAPSELWRNHNRYYRPTRWDQKAAGKLESIYKDSTTRRHRLYNWSHGIRLPNWCQRDPARHPKLPRKPRECFSKTSAFSGHQWLGKSRRSVIFLLRIKPF